MAAAARFHDLTPVVARPRRARRPGWRASPSRPRTAVRASGARLMTALLDHIAAAGYPLSRAVPGDGAALQIARLGIRGLCYEAVLPARSLRTITPVQREPPRWPAPHRTMRRRSARCTPRSTRSARDCGPLSWDEVTITAMAGRRATRFSYLGADGFVAYRWRDGNDEILVERAVAGSQATMRDIWSLLASSSSIASTVRARVSPAEPFGIMMREARHGAHQRPSVDAAGGGRAGGGRWPRLSRWARDRRCRCGCRCGSPGQRGGLDCSPSAAARERSNAPKRLPLPRSPWTRAVSRRYTPARRCRLLRRSGLASGGDPDADAVLDAAFAAQPFCLDTF